MAAPVLVNSTGIAGSVSASALTVGLPGSRTNGNLLISWLQLPAVTGRTISIAGTGWTLGDQNSSAGSQGAWAWCVVNGSEGSAAWSWTGGAAACHGDMHQFSGAAGSPIGTTNKATGSGTPITVAGITSSQDNVAILALMLTAASTPVPAFWTAVSNFSDGFGSNRGAYGVVAISGATSEALSLTIAGGVWNSFGIEMKGSGSGTGLDKQRASQVVQQVLESYSDATNLRASQVVQQVLESYSDATNLLASQVVVQVLRSEGDSTARVTAAVPEVLYSYTTNAQRVTASVVEVLEPHVVVNPERVTASVVQVLRLEAQGLRPDLFADVDIFYAPSVTQPAETLTPALVVDTDTVFAPTVLAGAVTLLPSLVSDSDTFYSPSVIAGAITLAPPLVVDTDAIFAPHVLLDQTVVAALVVDADSFYAPTVLKGAVILQPSLVTDADTFHAPTVAAGAVTIAPPLLLDTDVIFAAHVVYDQTLVAALVVDADSITTPLVLIGAAGIQPGFVADLDVIYAPTVLRSTWTISHDIGRVIDADVIYPPSAPSTHVLAPELVTDLFEQIIQPTVTSAWIVQPGRVLDTDDIFGSPTVIAGPVTVRPPLVISPDIFLVPFVARQGTQGGGGGGGGGNNPKDIKYASSMLMGQSGLVIAVGMNTTTAKVINCRMAMYATAAGAPAARLAVSVDKTSVALGDNVFPLVTPTAVLAGQTIWIAFQGDATLAWLLQNSPQGSRFNNDLFSDGISDPFGNASIDNKKAPLFAIYLESAPATIAPDRLVDTDTFQGASISKSNEIAPSFVISDDSIWPPTASASNEVFPPHVDEPDSFGVPGASATITLLPGLVIDSDIVIDPAMNAIAPPGQQISTPIFVDADTFYPPEVIPQGAALQAALYLDEDVLYEPLIRPYDELFIEDFLDDFDDIPAPEVISTYTLDASLYVDIDQIDGAEVLVFAQGQILEPTALVVDEDVFYAPRVRLPVIPVTIFGDESRRATLLGSTTGRQVDIKGDLEE